MGCYLFTHPFQTIIIPDYTKMSSKFINKWLADHSSYAKIYRVSPLPNGTFKLQHSSNQKVESSTKGRQFFLDYGQKCYLKSSFSFI